MANFGSGVVAYFRDAFNLLSAIGSLPPIRGKWYFVDPYSGSDSSGGTYARPVKTLRAAYNKCITSAGDGIAVMARPSATSADTTAYLGGCLTWAKHGITVVGIAAKHRYNCRARIASVDRAYSATTQFSWTTTTITDSRAAFLDQGFQAGDAVLVTAAAGTAITALNIVSAVTASTLTLTDAVTANAEPGVSVISTHCRPLINVTGRGNSFINLGLVQNGTVATDDGAILISADDNYLEHCYLNGASNATVAAQDTAYDLTVNASEITVKDCILGSNATIRASSSAHLVLGVSTKQIGQVFFENLKIVSYSATAGHGAVKITNVATLGGWVQFDDKCSFVNWDSGALTALTAAIIGVDTSNMGILCDAAMVGWAILVDATWDNVYTTRPVAAAHGGRGILVE
jgi:hypothetical protein